MRDLKRRTPQLSHQRHHQLEHNWSSQRIPQKRMVSRKNPGKDLNFTLYNKLTAKFDNRIYACCEDDFEFKSRKTNDFLDLQKAATTPYKDLASIRFRWRYQKNKNHGEKSNFKPLRTIPTTALATPDIK